MEKFDIKARIRANNIHVEALEPFYGSTKDPELEPDPEFRIDLADPTETGLVVTLAGSPESLRAVASAMLVQLGRALERSERDG